MKRPHAVRVAAPSVADERASGGEARNVSSHGASMSAPFGVVHLGVTDWVANCTTDDGIDRMAKNKLE
ncbi:MAG: hypothetical protein ABWX82_00440, partial [Leifsonia sp.]